MRLAPPRDVRPYVRGNKTGRANAAGLIEAARCEQIADVPVKSSALHNARSDLALSRTTLVEWVGAVGVALQPLADRLGAQLRQQPVLHADETPVALLDPKTGKTKRAYLFAYSNARHPGADPPRIVFEFQTSRSGQHARQLFGHWRGSLMVDAGAR